MAAFLQAVQIRHIWTTVSIGDYRKRDFIDPHTISEIKRDFIYSG